ncbi:MAG: PilZ domain-containing protein [Sandaracinaceae bacterium]
MTAAAVDLTQHPTAEPRPETTTLIVGRFSAEQGEAVRMALSRAGHRPRFVGDGTSARRILGGRGPVPGLVLVDVAMVEIEPLLTWIRGRAELFGAMVVAVAPKASDGVFREAVAAGCDDVVTLGDTGAITRRAAKLIHYDPQQRPPVTQGRAVVVHPSVQARRLLGRTLRLAGFDVGFAETEVELASCMERGPVELVVAACCGEPAAAASIEAARRLSGVPDLPCVLVGNPSKVRRDEALNGLERIGVVREHAAPDTLLFVANELLRPGVKELRSSPRVLADQLCSFRVAGELEPAFGLTYNLSGNGLYVRTLDPPKRGARIWFELRPPHESSAVHLRGTVVWVRSVENGPGGAAPPGFGIRIDDRDCPPTDLAHYRATYRP